MPSPHLQNMPVGARYRWEVASNSVALPSLPESWLDWIFNPTSMLQRGQREPRVQKRTEDDRENRGNYFRRCALENEDKAVDLGTDLVLKHLPAGPGRRNRQVFELARVLRAVPHLADAGGKDIDQLEQYVRAWHNEGVRRGLIATEPFEETWIDLSPSMAKSKISKRTRTHDRYLPTGNPSPATPSCSSVTTPKVFNCW